MLRDLRSLRDLRVLKGNDHPLEALASLDRPLQHFEHPAVLGLAVGGSWLTNQLDEFSDLDLILVTKNKISGDKNSMIAYANAERRIPSPWCGVLKT